MTRLENPFNAFTARADGIKNRLQTELSVAAAFDPLQVEEKDYPRLARVEGLWDTGATGSVISERLAQELELVPCGQMDVLTAGGPMTSDVYVVNMLLPNNVGLAGIQVTTGPLQLQGFDMLIGMNVISQGDFSITNKDGKTCFTFRTPSCREIDYVKEHNMWLKRHVQRNDPCFCGSNKKFKVCCLNKLN